MLYVRTKFYKIESGKEEWLDYERIVPILKKVNYNGCISIVYEGEADDRVEQVRLAAHYLRELSAVDGVRCLKEQDGGEHVFHLFVVRVAERDRIRQALSDIGVATGVHYPLPLHIQPCCAHLGYSEGEFPVAEKLASEILSLPMFPELLPGQVDEVVDGLRSLV